MTKSRDLGSHWGIWIDPNDTWMYGEGGNYLSTPFDQGWHHVAISQNATATHSTST